jgi:hypothetical protein
MADRMQFFFFLLGQASIPAALLPGVSFPPALFSIALFILLLMILLFILLAIPIHLNLNFSKQGPSMRGSYRIAWLGFVLRKREVFPQPAVDSLVSILEKDAEAEKDKAYEGGKAGDSRDEQKSDIKRSPKLNSFLNAAPAISHLFIDLLKSVVFQKLSCRLCFGLNDPAETAVVSGYLWSVASALGLFREKVSIEPFFEGERLEGEFAAELKIKLLWIAKAVIDALREKEIRSLIREINGWD